MTAAFSNGYLGLESVGIELFEIRQVVDLMTVAAQAPEGDARFGPGIRFTAEMVADRLDEVRQRVDNLMNEWLADTMAAKTGSRVTDLAPRRIGLRGASRTA